MSANANKAEALFEQALKFKPEERAVFLAGACGDDAELRRRVEELLKAQSDAGGFLPTEARSSSTIVLPLTEKPGTVIGRYKLLEQIGEGGFGVVYVAEQREPVKRRVALKIIKLGMDTKEVVARFEAERQALALMDHPNIAKVLDAGATGNPHPAFGHPLPSDGRGAGGEGTSSVPAGRPYFVMELVRGIRITEYCDQNNLSTTERLKLFIQVCNAIQHAHQKGVIHRDIKPSNILVTLHDGVPVPKVIDFGIAKATQQELTEKTVYTQLHQFVGTPAYMSPEQAEMSGLDIDTRSDIYSLGVLLYELLTGSTPFDSKELLKRGLDEIVRIIREVEPPRPSTKLNTLNADDLTTAAKHRGANALKLVNLVRGDLDWVVMKCLEKDRTRRYETANGLAIDLKRHLATEPVVARPPTAAYRLRKFARRNRLAFVAGSAVAAALLLGMAVSVWQAIRAEREASAARKAEVAAQSEARRASEESLAARNANQLALSRLVDMSVAEGWRRVEDGDLFGALTPFAEALQLEQGKPERAELHQMRLASVLQQCPKLVNVWSVGTNINHAEFSHDGDRLLTSSTLPSDSAFARIWDTGSGRPLIVPIEHARRINSLQWSQDETRILTATDDGTVRIWNASTGTPMSSPLRHEGGVLRARFNLDATKVGCVYVIAAPSGNRGSWSYQGLKIWDVASASVLGSNSLLHSDSASQSILFSPDGEGVVSASGFYDAKTVKHDFALTNTFHSSTTYGGDDPFHAGTDDETADLLATSSAFSGDGTRYFIAGDFDPSEGRGWGAVLRDGHDLRRVIARWDKENIPYLGRFSPDGKRLATANDDVTARIWNAETGAAETMPMKHDTMVMDVRFGADGRYLATVTRAGKARVWDAASGKPITPPLPHQSSGLRVAFNRVGTRILVATTDGTVATWDLTTLGIPRFTWGAQRLGNGESVSGEHLLCRDQRGAATIFNLRSGEQRLPAIFDPRQSDEAILVDSNLLTLGTTGWSVWNLSSGKRVSHVFDGGKPLFSQNVRASNGRWIACWRTNNSGGEISIFNSFSGERSAVIPTSFAIERVTVGPNGQQVWATQATTNRSSLIGWVWNLPHLEPVHSIENFTSQIEFRPTGRWIVSRAQWPVSVWDAETFRELPSIKCEAYYAVSPDDIWAATTDSAGGCRILNITNQTISSRILRHRGSMDGLTFSADGKMLLTAGSDRAIRFWSVPTGEPVCLPVALSSRVYYGISAAGKNAFITEHDDGSLRYWHRPETRHSVEDWLTFAHFFNSGDAPRLSNTSPATMIERWEALRGKYPDNFSISAAEVDAWERHDAWRCESQKDWSNSVIYLTRLFERHPDSGEFLPRRAAAYAQWAQPSAPVPADVRLTSKPEAEGPNVKNGQSLLTSASTNLLERALADYNRTLAWVDRFPELAKESRKPFLEERQKVLLKLNRLSEAQADALELKGIPPRPSNAGPHLIDLSSWYNDQLGTSLAPPGVRKLAGGVEFDLRGRILLARRSTENPNGGNPPTMTGVRIGRTCERLHFLHRTQTTNSIVGSPVSKFLIHLSNGETRTLEIKIGEDVWDFNAGSDGPKPTKRSVTAWVGSAGPSRPEGEKGQIFQSTWENPFPGVTVESIDFISALNGATPFLYAITADP